MERLIILCLCPSFVKDFTSKKTQGVEHGCLVFDTRVSNTPAHFTITPRESTRFWWQGHPTSVIQRFWSGSPSWFEAHPTKLKKFRYGGILGNFVFRSGQKLEVKKLYQEMILRLQLLILNEISLIRRKMLVFRMTEVERIGGGCHSRKSVAIKIRIVLSKSLSLVVGDRANNIHSFVYIISILRFPIP